MNPTHKNEIHPFAPVAIKLLQGVVYLEDREHWDQLMTHRAAVQEYFLGIAAEVRIFESEGFAFLKQKPLPEDSQIKLPELTVKRQLSYPITLLCVLLLEKLIEFDATGGEGTRLILSKNEIKESIRLFLPDKSNEAKLMDSIDSHINKLVDYGFLRLLKNSEGQYEVRRILKAKLDADRLLELKEKLREYR